jgi:hypothetical protein
MDDELKSKISEMETKMDAIHRSVERMRKFFMWTLIITAAMFILPFIGLVFMIPWYLDIIKSYSAF